MCFDAVETASIRLHFQRSDCLFIRINCEDPSLRTKQFSQSDCKIAWATTKVSNHLTICDVGFN